MPKFKVATFKVATFKVATLQTKCCNLKGSFRQFKVVTTTHPLGCCCNLKLNCQPHIKVTTLF